LVDGLIIAIEIFVLSLGMGSAGGVRLAARAPKRRVTRSKSAGDGDGLGCPHVVSNVLAESEP
jgi:hypothetical protein